MLNDIISQGITQKEKEHYIANMLVKILYSNDVKPSECHKITELFKKKVLHHKL